MEKYMKFAVAFCCLWTFVSCSQQHLVCKTVEDVFTAHVESSSPVRGRQGPPGKIGPRGIRGIPGDPGVTGPSGAPAVVDYDRINRVIANKVTSAIAEINSQIADLERNFTEFKELTQDRHLCDGRGGFYNRQKCFTIPHVSSSSDMNYNEAVAECAKTEALLAEIHDRTQQQALHDFAFSKMPSGMSYVYLWVGMEYQSSTSTLLYRSGKQTASSQFQWDQGYPTSSRYYKYLFLEVGSDGDSSVGLWNNYERTRDSYGVLCES